jgi:Ras-related protein Rap-1B
MKTGQGFLLVFSITSQSSLSELGELREQIIRIKDDDNVPIVIVGNKSDLEEDRVVSRQKAFGVSQSWGNAPYYETSARRRGKLSQFQTGGGTNMDEANVDEVFIDLCRQIIRRDTTATTSLDDDTYGYGHEDQQIQLPADRKRRRTGRKRRKDRCTIL